MKNAILQNESKLSGIYRIRSVVNGKSYIGSAVHLGRRFNRHIFELRAQTHHSKHLLNHVEKHGTDSLVFEVVELCNPDHLLDREQYYLGTEQPAFNNYKHAKSPQGLKMSPDSIRKQVETKRENGVYERLGKITSERNKGNKNRLGAVLSEETKDKIYSKTRGQKRSPDVIEKIRATSLGRKHTSSSRAKLSTLLKGNKNSLGHRHSEATKIKMASKARSVIQLSLNGDFIHEWRSVKDAASFFGVNPSNIRSTCNGIRIKCIGFKWQYKHDRA